MNWTEHKKEYDRQRWLRIKDTLDKEVLLLANKQWRLSNVEKTLYSAAKRRATRRGLEFNIELSDIVVPTHCPILNLELIPNQDGSKHALKNSPSLDKIDNTKGYIKGNIQVISNLANIMKSSASKEELHLFAKWVTHAMV